MNKAKSLFIVLIGVAVLGLVIVLKTNTDTDPGDSPPSLPKQTPPETPAAKPGETLRDARTEVPAEKPGVKPPVPAPASVAGPKDEPASTQPEAAKASADSFPGSKEELAARFEQFNEAKDVEARAQVLQALGVTLSSDALTAFLKSIQAMNYDIWATLQELIPVWFKQDADAVLAWGKRLYRLDSDHPDDVAAILRAVVFESARKDPVAAEAWVSDSFEGALIPYLFAVIAWEAAHLDHELAAQLADTLPPGPDRQALLQEILRGRIASGDLEGALEWVQGLPDAERLASLPLVADLMADTDAPRALALLQDLPPSPSRTDALVKALFSLAQSNPEQAVGFVMNLDAAKEGGTMEFVVRDLVLALPAERGEDRLELLAQLPPGGIRDRAVAHVGFNLGFGDPAQAKAWAETLPEKDMKAAGVFGVSKFLAGKDLNAVEQWIEDLPDGPLRGAARAGMAVAMLQEDIELAKTMALDLTEGWGREAAMMEVVARYTTMFSGPAEQWIEQLPSGRSRDRAYQVHVFTRSQLGQAVQPNLTARIEDQAIRAELDRNLAALRMADPPPADDQE